MNGYLQHVESDDDHPISVAVATLKQLLEELSFRAFLERIYLSTELSKADFRDILYILEQFDDVATDTKFDKLWRTFGDILEETPGLKEVLRDFFK